ncbi:MAG: sugar transferase [Puniceicoccales bacterium]|jgi:lipopolysaccharide/colanic/teichoic acid biosynthesis glycosyltransferase|nr:sugar transferase [Puniceicoccales bacterium]
MLKRTFDIAFSFSVLLFGAPVLLLLSLLVRLKIGTPVFFVQERVGKNGSIFRMVKFRSMTNARNAQGELLPDADRLTPFGSFLRRTSLDELPEFWNVLTGSMSVVGPRPLLPRYLPRYTPEQARRNEVPPGITGWTAVNGRNAISWEEKFKLDVWYVDNRSMLLDLKIVLLTLLKALRGGGVSAPGEATMPEFLGNNNATKCPA